jgi:hypothetical protein
MTNPVQFSKNSVFQNKLYPAFSLAAGADREKIVAGYTRSTLENELRDYLYDHGVRDEYDPIIPDTLFNAWIQKHVIWIKKRPVINSVFQPDPSWYSDDGLHLQQYLRKLFATRGQYPEPERTSREPHEGWGDGKDKSTGRP